MQTTKTFSRGLVRVLSVAAVFATASEAHALPALGPLTESHPSLTQTFPVAEKPPVERRYERLYERYEQETGQLPGRNIADNGVQTESGVRSARPAELRESIAVLRRGLGIVPPTSTGAVVTDNATLAAIAECESGGDPTIEDATGTYKGLYQFDDATWESVGGTGSANEAPAEEQTMRAQMLLDARGTSPWPVCGS